jgi:hypothetical protein
MQLLARRSILQSGALAAAALGLGTQWPKAARAAAGGPGTGGLAPVTGMVAAWVSLDLQHGAAIRLAQLAGAGQAPLEIADGKVALATLSSDAGGILQSVAAAASSLAIATVARSWNVSSAALRLEPGRIVHVETGRSVNYRAWIDIV